MQQASAANSVSLNVAITRSSKVNRADTSATRSTTRLARRLLIRPSQYTNYDAVFGGISLSRHAISLTKKPFSDKLLQPVSPNWVRVLCGPHIMQAIPLQRPLGWPSVLWSDFPAAEDAIASKQLDILSGGIAVPCVESHPNGCECSAAGLGGRTRSPDPPRSPASGPWPTNIPPVYAPFAFTCPPDSFMLGSWPR